MLLREKSGAIEKFIQSHYYAENKTIFPKGELAYVFLFNHSGGHTPRPSF
jgi:hypothetical protein